MRWPRRQARERPDAGGLSHPRSDLLRRVSRPVVGPAELQRAVVAVDYSGLEAQEGVRIHVTFKATRSFGPELECLNGLSVIVGLDGGRRSAWTPTGEVRARSSRSDVVLG